VIALAVVVCTTEFLGAVGLFRLAPITAVLALIGLAGWIAAHRLGRRGPSSVTSSMIRTEASSAKESQPRNSRASLVVALAAASVVIADWSTRTVDAVNHGMSTPDTIWYHMPFAARFVQQGSITPLHFVDFGTYIAFYPANGELFHALGILFFGNDFLSPFMNMGWLGLALLAGWCVGRAFGVAPVTLVGAAVLMATPALVSTQPGGAYTDIVGLALVASAVALIVNTARSFTLLRGPGLFLAALAAGLAMGTKFSFIAPILLLTVGVWVVLPHGSRLRNGALWTLFVLLTGSFWYIRNLAAIGNPLPSVTLHLGPIKLQSPSGPPASNVAHFLLNSQDWHKYFLPGLREALGPAWWAILALTATALVLGAWTFPSRPYRMLALVAAASAVAYVLSPQPLVVPGLGNGPYNFVYDLRYSFSAFVIGLTMLPIVPLALRPRARWLLLGLFGVVLAATQVDSSLWPTGISPQFNPAIQGTDSYIGLSIGFVTFAVGCVVIFFDRRAFAWSSPASMKRAPVFGALGIALLACAFGVQTLYLRDRYLNTQPLAPLYAWAQGVQNTRIALTGPLTNDSYPLYGKDDSNYVQVIGLRGGRGSFTPVSTCEEFRREVDAGHYNDVVTVSISTSYDGDSRFATNELSRETAWVAEDPKSRLIYRRRDPLLSSFVISVFRLTEPLGLKNC
jgi:hypothetical protein